MAKEKLSTESYKGVRDFYPEDMAIQNYIFDTWKKVSKGAGFVEYSASILEPLELYQAKSGSEIADEQTFSFTDKGDRKVALRPEMTPTLARMVAAKRRSLKFPLRWFSIPNVFRYERPQKGRKREHWQLNCDIMGIADTSAEVEIVKLSYDIMKAFGAKDEDFTIKINSRKLLNDLYKHFNLDESKSGIVSKILDKKEKIDESAFKDALMEVIGEQTEDFVRLVSSNERFLEILGKDNPNAKDLVEVIEKLGSAGIKNVVFTPTLMRGFDYYTGMVFEVFDNSPENNRSLFGGGRYDNLLEIFGVEPVPTVGFGMGDVTIRDFLETHNLPTCEK